MEIEGYNMQAVAVGGYFAIRDGPLSDKFKADLNLRTRCTKMTNTHALAGIGKAGLPGGITNGKNETVLPIAPEAFKFSIERPKNYVSQMSIFLNL